MEELKLDKALYCIVCSRGPGTETIVVEDMLLETDGDTGTTVSPEEIFERIWPRESEEIKVEALEEATKEALIAKKLLADGKIEIAFYDEGVIYLCPPNTTFKEVMQKVGEVETGGIDGEIYETDKDQHNYVSAVIRAFVCGPNIWTSVSGWRKDAVETETMTKEQVEKFIEVLRIDVCRKALGLPEFESTGNEQGALQLMLTSECPVISVSAQKYLAGTSPTKCRGT